MAWTNHENSTNINDLMTKRKSICIFLDIERSRAVILENLWNHCPECVINAIFIFRQSTIFLFILSPLLFLFLVIIYLVVWLDWYSRRQQWNHFNRKIAIANKLFRSDLHNDPSCGVSNIWMNVRVRSIVQHSTRISGQSNVEMYDAHDLRTLCVECGLWM